MCIKCDAVNTTREYLSIFICSIANHTAQQLTRTMEQDEQG